MSIWVVRAGSRGQTEDLSLEDSRAFIGWGDLPDLSNVTGPEDILQLLVGLYPDDKLRAHEVRARQIFNFVKEIKIHDTIAIPLKRQPAIAFGKVVGEYEYLSKNPKDALHSRRVEWLGDPKPRSCFDQDILDSFRARLTVFRMRRNDADTRIPKIIKGETQTEEDDLASERQDLKQIASDRISDFIGRRFKGRNMEKLVAAVLRAQGFEIRENERKGADGGVDILAGREAMGFGKPHLCVQVKSGDLPIDSKTYDELKGVMNKFNATHGLFVSWGGFKRTVEDEAKRDFFNIRLWNAEKLVNEIQDVYSSLPKELQAKLPMQPVWMLIEEE